MKPVWPSRRLSLGMRRFVKQLSFALAACFFAVSLALPGHSLVSTPSATPASSNRPALENLIAQNANILDFSTPNYAVRVFREGNGVVRMNVFKRSAPTRLEQNAAPASLVGPTTSTVTYESFGSRDNRNVVFRTIATRSPRQAELTIADSQSGAVILREFATEIRAFTLPAPPEQDNLLDRTILGFETPAHAVRVFTDGSIRKMNVFNKLSSQQVVNGKVAQVVDPPMSPYENWVSYFAGEGFNSVSGRWFARVNSSGQAVLEFIDSNGNILLSEQRMTTVPLIVNIPSSDIPPGVDNPATSADLSPYIVAVFGDQSDLEQIRRLYNSPQAPRTFGGQPLQDPFFESARQGRFINAGSFDNRDQAAALVSYLRSQGFNARLVFRDFRYR
jgi:hypothetical protein